MPDVLASGIRSRYEFHEVRSACAVMKAVSPEESGRYHRCAGQFQLLRELAAQGSGNNSEMAETLNRALREPGMERMRLRT